MFVEGARALLPALTNGRLREVFATEAGRRRREDLLEACRPAQVPVRVVSDEVMAALTSTTSTPDIAGVAAASIGGPEVLRDGPWPAMLLRGIRDPAAMGLILATGAAFGARAAVEGATAVDLGAAKVVRAAAGAHFTLRLARSASDEDVLRAASAAGAGVVCLHPEGTSLYKAVLPDAMMLVVQDGEPMSEGALVAPPVPGVLGVAQAAAMIWYEWARQRA